MDKLTVFMVTIGLLCFPTNALWYGGSKYARSAESSEERPGCGQNSYENSDSRSLDEDELIIRYRPVYWPQNPPIQSGPSWQNPSVEPNSPNWQQSPSIPNRPIWQQAQPGPNTPIWQQPPPASGPNWQQVSNNPNWQQIQPVPNSPSWPEPPPVASNSQNNRPIVQQPTSNAFQDCIRSCPVTSEYNPVCGSNNETYANPSRLECAQRCGVEVTFQRRYPCSVQERPSTMRPSTPLSPTIRLCLSSCRSSFDKSPVCGSDGITYPNIGKLQCAIDCGVDVKIQSQSSCDGVSSTTQNNNGQNPSNPITPNPFENGQNTGKPTDPFENEQNPTIPITPTPNENGQEYLKPTPQNPGDNWPPNPSDNEQSTNGPLSPPNPLDNNHDITNPFPTNPTEDDQNPLNPIQIPPSSPEPVFTNSPINNGNNVTIPQDILDSIFTTTPSTDETDEDSSTEVSIDPRIFTERFGTTLPA